MTLRWVETETYEGPDRRLKRLWRLIERRRMDQSTPLPSLSTKIRQLRVQVAAAHTQDRRIAFLRHAHATKVLAELLRQQEAAAGFKDMMTVLESHPEAGDFQYVADARLAQIAERLALVR